LRQEDQARTDFAAIEGDQFVMEQLARLRTRKELARFTLFATLTTAPLVLAGIEALFR